MSLEKKNSEAVFRIKNMVCPRCIEAVEGIFSLMGKPAVVTLGEAKTTTSFSEEEKEILKKSLSEKGFELLGDAKPALISQVKTKIVELVHHQGNNLDENLSSFLANSLNQDYSQLSRLFSSVEGITIERYYTRQRVEKVKELIFYGEKSLSEIAYQLGYSSVAYLSAQFKKETGMTPSEFKGSSKHFRRSLDEL